MKPTNRCFTRIMNCCSTFIWFHLVKIIFVLFDQQAHSDCKKPKAILTDNYITNNHCYGICIKKDSKLFSESNDPEHGVQLEMTNNVFEDNISGDVGHFLENTD